MNICVVSYVMNGVSVVVVRLFFLTNLKSGMGQPIVVSIMFIKMRGNEEKMEISANK